MSYPPATEANGSGRPPTPHMSKSFSRLTSSPSSPLARSRSNTLQTGPIEMKTSALVEKYGETREDIFEKSSLISSAEGTIQDVSEMEILLDVPEGFDELPIELLSMIDR